MYIKHVHKNRIVRLISGLRNRRSLATLITVLICSLAPANAATYRFIGENYLGIGNRWEYQIHVTEDPEYGVVDWWGTSNEEVIRNEVIEGYNTALVEENTNIPGIETSWSKINYYLTSDHLMSVRYEDYDWIRIVRNNNPFREAPVWISDSDNNRYLGRGEHTGIWKSPSFEWDGYGDTYVTFLQTETISVPAGTFNCIVVLMHAETHEFEGIWAYTDLTAWVEPTIGPVKTDEYFWGWIPGEGASEGRETSELTWTNILPAKVIGPNPKNGATNQSIDVDISWSGSQGATSYDVYFGECGNMQFKGNQPETTYDPGALLSCTAYCWRIDSVNTNGTTTGDEWSFTTGAFVPDVLNMTESAAETVLNNAGLVKGTVNYDNSRTVAADDIMEQNPPAGVSIACGSLVNLVISDGPSIFNPDINNDNRVNLADFEILAHWWLQNNCSTENAWCQGADLFPAGTVDILDLDILFENWLKNFSLAAHWTLDDNNPSETDSVIDVSGNENHGTPVNAMLSTEGALGDCLEFNGTTDSVDCGNDPSLQITDNLSISGWINLSAVGCNQFIVSKNNCYHLFVQPNNKVRFGITRGGLYYHEDSVSTLNINSWYHVVGVNDGVDLKVYINSFLEEGLEQDGGAIDNNAVNLWIGSKNGGSYKLSGKIDDVRIYNQALSEEEILSLSQCEN